MNIYLAARYSRKEEMAEVARILNALGHTVLSTWIWTKTVETVQHYPAICIKDLNDLKQANHLIFFGEYPGTAQKGGGRHVEFGYSIAQDIPIDIITPFPGQYENVFQAHPSVKYFSSIGEWALYYHKNGIAIDK
jgi:hypothetical protein